MIVPIKRLLPGTVGVACLVLATVVQAQQGGFPGADANNDSKISPAEFKEYVGRMLSDFDQIEPLFKKLDADGSGDLDEGEFANRMAAIRKMRNQESEPAQQEAESDKQEQQEEQQEVVEFAERYDRMFANRDPKLGDTISGVQAYDEEGNEFSLDSTRGKYTVIAFGCLT